MAVDFSAFDEQVDLNALQKEVQEADDSQFEDVPDGDYDVSFDKMEIKTTKKGDKLMFSVQCSILEGNQKGRKIFFNRTISGNTSQKWTNGMAIKSVCTWLDHHLQSIMSVSRNQILCCGYTVPYQNRL